MMWQLWHYKKSILFLEMCVIKWGKNPTFKTHGLKPLYTYIRWNLKSNSLYALGQTFLYTPVCKVLMSKTRVTVHMYSGSMDNW
jgi:hypothetical protein